MGSEKLRTFTVIFAAAYGNAAMGVDAAAAYGDATGALVLHTGGLIVAKFPAGTWVTCNEGGKPAVRTNG